MRRAAGRCQRQTDKNYFLFRIYRWTEGTSNRIEIALLSAGPSVTPERKKFVLKNRGIELYTSGVAHRHVDAYARAKLCADAMISA